LPSHVIADSHVFVLVGLAPKCDACSCGGSEGWS
jgi:hypothetical protein